MKDGVGGDDLGDVFVLIEFSDGARGRNEMGDGDVDFFCPFSSVSTLVRYCHSRCEFNLRDIILHFCISMRVYISHMRVSISYLRVSILHYTS